MPSISSLRRFGSLAGAYSRADTNAAARPSHCFPPRQRSLGTLPSAYAIRLLQTGTMHLIRLLLLAVVVAPAMSAQRFQRRVAVSITEDSTTFGSLFTSAFRSIGDVIIVDADDAPEYVLSGIVMCNPNCKDALSYIASLELASPLDTVAHSPIWKHVTADMPPTQKWALTNMIEDATRVHERNLVHWGRQRYEVAAREFVREIDTRCFEKLRIMERTNFADTMAVRKVRDRLKATQWMC